MSLFGVLCLSFPLYELISVSFKLCSCHKLFQFHKTFSSFNCNHDELCGNYLFVCDVKDTLVFVFSDFRKFSMEQMPKKVQSAFRDILQSIHISSAPLWWVTSLYPVLLECFKKTCFAKYSMIQGSRVIRSNELKEMNYCLNKHFIHFIFGVIYLFLKSSTFCYKQLLILPHGGHERKKNGFWKQMKSSLMGIKTFTIKITENPAGFFSRVILNYFNISNSLSCPCALQQKEISNKSTGYCLRGVSVT